MTKNKSNKIELLKKAVVPVAGLLLIGSATFTFLSMQTVVYTYKTAPAQYLLGNSLNGLTEEQLQQELEVILDQAKSEEIPFRYEDEVFSISSEDMGLAYSFKDVYDQVKKYEDELTTRELIKDIILRKKIRLVLDEENTVFNIQGLKNKSTGIYDAKNAYFKKSENGLEIIQANSGLSVNEEALLANIKSYLLGEARTVEILVEESVPTVLGQDLEIHRNRFADFITKPIVFASGDAAVSLYLNESPDKILFSKTLGGLTLSIDQDYLDTFIDQELAPAVNKDPETVEITWDGSRATFSSVGAPGYKINQEELIVQTSQQTSNAFFSNSNPRVDVPLIELEPEFIIPEELQERGVKELITVGHTTYYGSPANRIHNINVGVKQFSGVILPKQENFSFNTTLGEVDESTGYLPELVIKGAETIPEFGGGLCQVSTTFYRAALFSGLEIVDRAPHSYAVSYYSQVMGHGLDATIYPPFRDLVVKNTTEGDILMQAYTDGAQAYFRFFGTDPELEVEFDGPYISNHRSVGTPQVVIDETLAPGTKKQVAEAHAGFDALWYRIIKDKDGNITKEPIESRYRAVPAKVISGPTESRTSEADPVLAP